MTKSEIRKNIKNFFLSSEGKQVKADVEALQRNTAYCKAFLNKIPFYNEAKTIFAYYPLKQEFPTHGLLKQAYSDGKIIGLPLVDGKELIFKKVRFEDGQIFPLEQGAFGVLEPSQSAETLFMPDKPENIGKTIEFPLLLLIPGRAFTKTGERLGWGGGFYDRFLEKLFRHKSENKVFLVGLCFSAQLVENLPTEDFDRSVDIVLTEKM